MGDPPFFVDLYQTLVKTSDWLPLPVLLDLELLVDRSLGEGQEFLD